jgi:hypothetical protein
VDFSEARDLFVIIYQIPGPNCKTMDCGLILKKLRGLNEKCRKLEFLGIIFLKETRGPSPRVRGPRAAPIHGHCLGGGSPENGRNGAPVRGTSPRLSLTGCKRGGGGSDTTGRWWEQSAEEALGGVNVVDSEASN